MPIFHSLFFHRRTYVSTALFVVLLVVGANYAQSALEDPLQFTPVTTETVRTSLSTVGMIISEPDTSLRFASTDVISQVFVKEGQRVVKGQKLAMVLADGLEGSVMTAMAALQTAESRLLALHASVRPEEIAVIDAEMERKQVEIERLERQLKKAAMPDTGADAPNLDSQEAVSRLSSTVATTGTTVSTQYLKAASALNAAETIFNRLDVQDSIVKSVPGDAALLQKEFAAIRQAVEAAMQGGSDVTDADEALLRIGDAQAAIGPVARLLARASILLGQLPQTDSFTDAKKSDAVALFSAQQSIVQESLSRLDDAAKNIRDASASQIALRASSMSDERDTKEDLQGQILVLQAAAKVGEAQRKLKTAPPLQTDLDQASARVSEARGNLVRVMAEYHKAVLTSPVDGTVITVNLTPGQSPPMTEPAVIVRSSAEHGVLVNLSDDDIASITASSTGSIAFDSTPGKSFALRMDALADTSSHIDGIGNYRKLSFDGFHPELADGMSGNVTIVLSERRDVLTIPMDLVNRDLDGRTFAHIRRNGNMMLVPIVVGLEGDAGRSEIINGLTPHDLLLLL